MNSVTVRVPAKVNLQLAVGPLRDDGYHDLVNVFHAVSIFDEVTATAETGMSVRVEGESVDGAILPLIRRADAVEPRPMPDDGHHLADILS